MECFMLRIVTYYMCMQITKKGSVICSVIRYEDFSASPVASTASLLQFLGFDIDANVKDFLAQHTVAKLGGEYSTYR